MDPLLASTWYNSSIYDSVCRSKVSFPFPFFFYFFLYPLFFFSFCYIILNIFNNTQKGRAIIQKCKGGYARTIQHLFSELSFDPTRLQSMNIPFLPLFPFFFYFLFFLFSFLPFFIIIFYFTHITCRKLE